MTARAESSTPAGKAPIVLGDRWRAQAERAQEAGMPSGRVVVSCPARSGIGGLGRHLQEISEALDRREQPRVLIGESTPEDASAPSHGGVRAREPAAALAAALAPVARFSPAWRIWCDSVSFDAYAARRLGEADHLIGFNGTSLAQFSLARRDGRMSISLMSANSHFRHVIRQHAVAHRQYPVERPWATRLLRRNLREYALADRIYVASSYVRESFLREGFSEQAISLFPLTPHPRFDRAGREPERDTFDIVYAGGLTVHKGVPLLIDAVRRLAHTDVRLILIGGPKSRPMRRFLAQACAEDRRIEVSPGDPLPHLRRARLYVHAAYEDVAYAPAEALACGVPVIVSEDTGMKDLIDAPGNGLVVPTGAREPLIEAIEAAYNGQIFGGL
jgi:glycosyltransferase involved in cell wall biosynthesis